MLIWFVVGDAEFQLFSTKEGAERRARALFPTEDAARRYARIYYRSVNDE